MHTSHIRNGLTVSLRHAPWHAPQTVASLPARFLRRYSMKTTRLRRRKRSNLWKMQNLVRQAALLRLHIL